MATVQANSLTSIDCPVCGSDSFKPLFVKREEAFVECRQCRLMLINPPPALSTSSATYDEQYSNAYITKADKKLKRCRGWVQRIRRQFVASGRWLDVGCSAGFVVKAAAEAGFEAYGVEVEAAAIAYGRASLGLDNLRCGILQAQQYPANYFDVISLYDVIEHVPDSNEIVAELFRILKASGVIEIRTPDLRHWQTPRELSTWKEVKPSEHLYYFDADTLRKLFDKHNLYVAHKRFMLKPALDIVFRKRL